MPECACMNITPIQEEKLKIAVENTCELCHDYVPSLFLEIHSISRHPTKEMKHDPSTRILIVCQIVSHPYPPAPGVDRKAAGSGETPFILYPEGYTENPGIRAETLPGSG